MLYTEECMRDKRISTNTYPQIIDKLTFEQVQKRLIQSKILASANSAVARYILTRRVFCGYCSKVCRRAEEQATRGKSICVSQQAKRWLTQIERKQKRTWIHRRKCSKAPPQTWNTKTPHWQPCLQSVCVRRPYYNVCSIFKENERSHAEGIYIHQAHHQSGRTVKIEQSVCFGCSYSTRL